jgi:hypothetical protein
MSTYAECAEYGTVLSVLRMVLCRRIPRISSIWSTAPVKMKGSLVLTCTQEGGGGGGGGMEREGEGEGGRGRERGREQS